MKLKIERQFRDKITGVLHKVDDVIEVDEERGNELVNDDRGLVTLIKEKTASKPKTASKSKVAAKAKSKKSE